MLGERGEGNARREGEGDDGGMECTCNPCSPASYLFSPSSVSTAT